VTDFFHYLTVLSSGVRYTLELTFAAVGLGLVLAIPVTAARRSSSRAYRFLGTAFVELLRAIPPLPWLFLVFFALPTMGLTPLQPMTAGILVFGIISAAYLTEIYRAGFRAVPAGQAEAAAALGLGPFHTYARILVPQAVKTALPLALAYFIGALKDSAIVSVIGVQDISARAVAQNVANSNGLIVFLAAAAIYLCLSLPVALFGRWLSYRLGTQNAVRVGA